MSEFFRRSLYRPSAPKLVQVKKITQVSPSLISITLTSEELASFPEYCPAAHIKLFLPLPGQDRPMLPSLGPNGPVWPSRELKPIVRTYSVRRFRAAERELDVEFAVHGTDGPASRFAKEAALGDYVGISHPGGPDPMIPKASQYFLAGDMSAAPAIASILEHLPADAIGHAFLRADDADDVRELEHPAGVQLHWFTTRPDEVHEILSSFKTLELPERGAYYWVGGEHTLVVGLRKYLITERGISKDDLYALPYWRHRFSEEGYHDIRDEVMSGAV